ncbi:TetR/AcrR family transcriptional regulator [Paroceanicella profunda]|nr:TetR/AcrR family transcriptional regulator [Paroceanicella profunda]
MELFWRHGYEGVSVADLTSAIGIAAPSLYAAFGNKAGLYREALACYEARDARDNIARMADAPGPEAAARVLLERVATMLTTCTGPRCCMIATGMVACSAEHEDIAGELSTLREGFRQDMARILTRWVPEAQAQALARYLVAVTQGLSIQARDGATPGELAQVVDQACLVFRMPAEA